MPHTSEVASVASPFEDAPRQVEVPGYGVVQIIPEPGWGGSPATAPAVEAVSAKVEKAIEKAPLLGRDPAGLVRDEVKRGQVVERLAGMSKAEIEAQLAETPRFAVYPGAPPARALHVDWHAYSQNTDGAKQLVTRALEEPGLFGLRDRIGVVPRATFEAAVDVTRRADPELVWLVDVEEQTAVGVAATEVAVRFEATAAELPMLQDFLHQNGERRPAVDGERPATPVKYAWPSMDAEIVPGDGAELPPGTVEWKRAVRNYRSRDDGREVSVLSRHALAGWDRAVHVLVNASLWARIG